ncbi:MAG: DUF5752 family protein [Candidatus Pacearchaeota archaeon]|nr:DUF5752 family protein [Candidatus Pacearchaeota archaeon]
MVIKKEKHFFYACNGDVLKSLEDLLSFLREADDSSVAHHFNEEKNDFANWTRDVLKDKTLAKSLDKSLNRDDMIFAIEKKMESKLKKKSKTKKEILAQIKSAMSNE